MYYSIWTNFTDTCSFPSIKWEKFENFHALHQDLYKTRNLTNCQFFSRLIPCARKLVKTECNLFIWRYPLPYWRIIAWTLTYALKILYLLMTYFFKIVVTTHKENFAPVLIYLSHWNMGKLKSGIKEYIYIQCINNYVTKLDGWWIQDRCF